MQKMRWLGGIFNDLLARHATANQSERAILEPVIFTLTVNYRRDLKHGRINPDDRARIDALLTAYQASAAPIRRKKNR
jgi:hypothetical protein